VSWMDVGALERAGDTGTAWPGAEGWLEALQGTGGRPGGLAGTGMHKTTPHLSPLSLLLSRLSVLSYACVCGLPEETRGNMSGWAHQTICFAPSP
jgi:hypothetical protein